jgi:hypothetical protein
MAICPQIKKKKKKKINGVPILADAKYRTHQSGPSPSSTDVPRRQMSVFVP